jgi:4-hydroxy-tetrahydrodipicolinate reductase
VIRVAVIGAAGRMGREACRAIAAAEDLDLVAAVSPSHAGAELAGLVGMGITSEVTVAADLDALAEAGVEVAVELTGPASVGDHLIGLLERGINAVVGASGLGDDDLERARELASAGPARALVVPNFAIGAVLMMRFAAEAARHLPDVEIIELHHDGKVDAPSGTALRTAEMIADARGAAKGAPVPDTDGHVADGAARGAHHAGVRIHSVRLPGLVAHQEVLFGGPGQTLTVRHDTLDRTAFMPGMLLACRHVHEVDGLAIGLEHVL